LAAFFCVHDRRCPTAHHDVDTIRRIAERAEHLHLLDHRAIYAPANHGELRTGHDEPGVTGFVIAEPSWTRRRLQIARFDGGVAEPALRALKGCAAELAQTKALILDVE